MDAATAVLFMTALLSWASGMDDRGEIPHVRPAGSKDDPAKSFPRGFLVKLYIRNSVCTGSFVSDTWILTAAHCTKGLGQVGWSQVENGDWVLDLAGDSKPRLQVEPLPSDLPDQWTVAVETTLGPDPPGPERDRATFEVVPERVVVHGLFDRRPEFLWKGHDLALVKVRVVEHRQGPGLRQFLYPVCLPGNGYQVGVEEGSLRPQGLLMAGYGRRVIAHCITDASGPERLQACQKQARCSQDHSTTFCPVNFTYQGHNYQSCVGDAPSPARDDPDCVLLRRSHPDTANLTVHLFGGFDGGNYVKACYPEFQGVGKDGKSKGWCATTSDPSGRTKQGEVTPESGWGFCSTEDPFQVRCGQRIQASSAESTEPMVADFLSQGHCATELWRNLRVEGAVEEEQPEDLPDQLVRSGVFCIGRNRTHSLTSDRFFRMRQPLPAKERFQEMPWSRPLEEAVYERNRNRYDVDGGPGCMGDSGGPLWKNTIDQGTGKVVPVLVGAFSFLLWGNCHGVHDPTYYSNVQCLAGWIYQYVDLLRTCTFTTEFVDHRVKGGAAGRFASNNSTSNSTNEKCSKLF